MALGVSLFISVSVIAVGGGACVLLSHEGRTLSAGWFLSCFGVAALTLFYPGPPWPVAAALAVLALALPLALPPQAAGSTTGWVPGNFRRALALGAIWFLSLLLLRASHRSPHLIWEVDVSSGGSHFYWALYTTSALFGLGFLTLILKRNVVHSWYGLGILFLSPIPSALASSARMRSEDGWLLALVGAMICLGHGLLAGAWLSKLRRDFGALDTSQWEELQG